MWQSAPAPRTKPSMAEAVDRGLGGDYTVVMHSRDLPGGLWLELEGLAGVSGAQDLSSAVATETGQVPHMQDCCTCILCCFRLLLPANWHHLLLPAASHLHVQPKQPNTQRPFAIDIPKLASLAVSICPPGPITEVCGSLPFCLLLSRASQCSYNAAMVPAPQHSMPWSDCSSMTPRSWLQHCIHATCLLNVTSHVAADLQLCLSLSILSANTGNLGFTLSSSVSDAYRCCAFSFPTQGRFLVCRPVLSHRLLPTWAH